MINAHIYLQELKQNRTSFLVWGGLLAALIVLGMSFFPILMKGDMLRQLQGFFETAFMKNIQTAFGFSLSALTDVLGYYAARNGIFIILIGSLFSVLLGSRIVSQDEYEKTAEFLLSRPVTRSEVMASKLAVLFTGISFISLVILVSGYAGLELFKGDADYRLASFLVHTFYSFLLMQAFGAIGLILSLLIKRGRPSNNIGVGIVGGAFFLDVLSRVTKEADWVGYFSPFKLLDAEVLRPGYGVTWWRVLYFLGLTLALWFFSFLIYRKKDILV